MSVLCMVSSVMTLSAISCDRFLAVICPLRTRVTQRKARYDDNDNHDHHDDSHDNDAEEGQVCRYLDSKIKYRNVHMYNLKNMIIQQSTFRIKKLIYILKKLLSVSRPALCTVTKPLNVPDISLSLCGCWLPWSPLPSCFTEKLSRFGWVWRLGIFVLIVFFSRVLTGNVCEINMFTSVSISPCSENTMFRATPESPQWSPVTRSSRLGPSAIWKATPSSKSRWSRRSTTSSSTSSCSSSRSCWWPSATPWSWPSSTAAQVRASGWGESRLRWG